MIDWENAPILRRGTWCYAETVRLEVRIIRQDHWWGSGDYEDPPEVRDDREVECFRVIYEIADKSGFTGGGQHLTLEEAMSEVQEVGRSLRWDQSSN